MICSDFVWEHVQPLDMFGESNVFYPLDLIIPGPGIRQIGTIPYAPSFQDGAVVKNPPTNARIAEEMSLIPRSGRFPGGGHGNPLQYTCLENPMNRGTW